MKVIRSSWLSLLVVPLTALAVAGVLWAELNQPDLNVHRVIKPVPVLSNIAPQFLPVARLYPHHNRERRRVRGRRLAGAVGRGRPAHHL